MADNVGLLERMFAYVHVYATGRFDHSAAGINVLFYQLFTLPQQEDGLTPAGQQGPT